MLCSAHYVGRGLSLNADICIIGGGIAGLTLALELESLSCNILVLESGGEVSDPITQSLYEGENIGLEYGSLENARSRFLGGSSNCWGGWCKPMDAIDFEQREWIPDSGWPIHLGDLQSYYSRARTYLRLHSDNYTEPEWALELAEKGLSTFPLAGSALVNQLIQFSPPVRFGKTYRDRLSNSLNISVLLSANVTEIERDPLSPVATRVHVKTLSGNIFSVLPKYVVLAAGGIENARLLLLSNRQQASGLGNERDLVGRYFMDHPRFRSSTVTLRDVGRHRALYDASIAMTRHRSGTNPNKIAAHLAPSATVQRQRGLPNSRTYLVGRYAFDSSVSFQAVKELRETIVRKKRFGRTRQASLWEHAAHLLASAIKQPQGLLGLIDLKINPRLPYRKFTLETVMEPIPNKHSRVTLSAQRDCLGLPKAKVDWRLTCQDKANISGTAMLLSREFCERDLARLMEYKVPSSDRDIIGCYHHMGTTRMHLVPEQGVVDENLRLHTLSNLYCVGSSVFPTGGSDCPTLTLTALAIRLADRLRQLFTENPVVLVASAGNQLEPVAYAQDP